MEASFCGPKPENPDSPSASELNYHFTTQDLMDVGKHLCQTLFLYCKQDIDIDQQI